MPKFTDFAVQADQFQLRIDCSLDADAVVGCHWVDPDSGRFLRESPWVETNRQHQATFDLTLPIAAGRYRFYISPRESGKDWGYLRGEQFLAIDAEVCPDGVRVERKLLTNTQSLRRERWPAIFREIFLGPFTSVWLNRHLMYSMVRRDILSRYRGSFADSFWAILNPLLLMLTYYFVFGLFLQTKFPGDPSKSGFVLFFISGMLPWLAMNESLARAANTTLEHRNLITKVIFPVEVLPVNLTLSGMVTGLTASVLFLFVLLATRGSIPITVLWLPVLWIPQFFLTAGLCYLLAAAGAFVRDLIYVMGLLLTMWFFLTPICYPETSLPAAVLPVLGKNPLYILVRAYRAIFIGGTSPEWIALGKLSAASLLVFYAGFAVFRRARKGFADVL
ncbi:ABC transporter permease [Bryobacter aggregatus]|uniref:ABC transporter permease n=1 Tax=Bryobacter aggregatus TaxID=360054 RepID=UPI0004E19396|nr:ABC transporter permease [Bryobacter aggregatus]